MKNVVKLIILILTAFFILSGCGSNSIAGSLTTEQPTVRPSVGPTTGPEASTSPQPSQPTEIPTQPPTFRALSSLPYGTNEEREYREKVLYMTLGTNIIENEYVTANTVNIKHPILDEDKVPLSSLKRIDKLEGKSYTAEGANIVEYAVNWGVKVAKSVGISDPSGLITGALSGGMVSIPFTASIESKFQYGNSNSSQNSSYYYSFTHEESSYGLAIQSTVENLQNYLDRDFKADLYNSAVSPAELFRTYGTHLLQGVNVGGMLEMFCEYENSSVTNSKEISASISKAFQFLISSSSSSSVEYQKYLSEFNESAEIKFYKKGGMGVALSIDSFHDSYKKWAESVADQPVLTGITQADDIIPIWKLLDESHSERVLEIKTYFDSFGAETTKKFLKNYGIHNEETTVPEGYTEIRNAEDLKNINNNPDGKYFITKDIQVTEMWVPIKNFTGILDGNGHKVDFYTSMQTSEKPYYGGLFGSAKGANIRNLMAQVSLNCDKEIDRTSYIGGLVGYAVNIHISKCRVSGSVINKNGQGDGSIGGLVGYMDGGTIEECANYAEVTGSNYNSKSGGIVGQMLSVTANSTIRNCYNRGRIEAGTNYIFGGQGAGGIVGQINSGKATKEQVIQNCYSTGIIVNNSYSTGGWPGGWRSQGGIVGDAENGKIKFTCFNCFWQIGTSPRPVEQAANLGGCKPVDLMGFITTLWPSDVWNFGLKEYPTLKWEN